MSKQFNDRFKDIPLRNISPVSMEYPNELIKIYTGNFNLSKDGKTYKLNGDILFKWFPDMGVKLNGSFVDDLDPMVDLGEEYEILINKKTIGKIKITNLNLKEKATCAGEGNRFIWGENNIPVTEITFSIPNMREFLGEAVKEITSTGVNLQKSRLTLDDKPYKIILDKLSDYKLRSEKLSDSGGYLITYAGKIIKNKGSITLSELHSWHDRFHHFLYFLNGRRVATMFYTGTYEGNNI